MAARENAVLGYFGKQGEICGLAELVKLGQQCSVKLDEQDQSQHTGNKNKSKGRPMSDSGTKARFYHAVKDALMAHLIKVDLKAELFS